MNYEQLENELISKTEYRLLAKDLIEMQYEMGNVEKNSKNLFFKNTYSSLTEIVNYAKPYLHKHGFAVIQTFNQSENGTVHINTILIHKSGQSIGGTLSMPSKDSTDPQKTGSAITYARRYAYAAILGLTPEEDDDGNKAAGKDNKTQEIRKSLSTHPSYGGEKAAGSGAQSPIGEISLEEKPLSFNNHNVEAKNLIEQLQKVETEEEFDRVNKELLRLKSYISGDQLKIIREVKGKFKK